MIRHIVLYTYKKDIEESVIQRVYKDLDEISARLPGRLSYSWGPYKSPEGRNQGFTHALITDFADEKARDAFLYDPERVAFSNAMVIPKMIDGVKSIISFDFEWS
jgi:hypothetical protein